MHDMGCVVGACVAEGVHDRSVCVVGAYMAVGMHAGETVTEAGGTHPTGMHSCLLCLKCSRGHLNLLDIWTCCSHFQTPLAC